MKTATYFGMYVLVLVPLFAMLLQLDRVFGIWRWLQAAYIIMYILFGIIIFISFSLGFGKRLASWFFMVALVDLIVLLLVTKMWLFFLVGVAAAIIGLLGSTSHTPNIPDSLPDLHEEPVKKQKYVASKNAKKYHKTTCRYANHIKAKDKITFSSEQEALEQGYFAHDC